MAWWLLRFRQESRRFNANTIRAVVALKLHAMIWSLLPLFFSALLLACTSATAQHEDVFDQ